MYTDEQRAVIDLYAFGLTLFEWLRGEFYQTYPPRVVTPADERGVTGRLYKLAKRLIMLPRPDLPGPDTTAMSVVRELEEIQRFYAQFE
jgi:hypothetical protein